MPEPYMLPPVRFNTLEALLEEVNDVTGTTSTPRIVRVSNVIVTKPDTLVTEMMHVTVRVQVTSMIFDNRIGSWSYRVGSFTRIFNNAEEREGIITLTAGKIVQWVKALFEKNGHKVRLGSADYLPEDLANFSGSSDTLPLKDLVAQARQEVRNRNGVPAEAVEDDRTDK